MTKNEKWVAIGLFGLWALLFLPALNFYSVAKKFLQQ